MRILFGLFLWTVTTHATIFVPIPLADQIKEADGLVHAIYLDGVSKKLPSGEIATENTFKLLSKSGLDSSKIINEQSFKVLTAGGTWQGLVYLVEGSPHFEKGEEVILLLHKGKFGYEVYGLGMGKYNIKTVDHKTVISSSVFPNDKNLGNISPDHINQLLLKIYGESLEKLNGKEYVYQKEKIKRDVASSKDKKFQLQKVSDIEREQKETQEKGIPLGGVLVFLLMGAGIIYYFNKK